MAITVGAFNRPWSTLTLDEAFRHTAEAGFAHTGLLRQNREDVVAPDTPPERLDEVGAMARAHGLIIDVIMVSVPLDGPPGEAVALILKQAENAARLGAGYLLSMGGKPEMFDAYCRVAREAAADVAARGVRLTVKPHGGITMTGADCARVVRAVDSPHFGVFYDPGNVAYYAGETRPEDVEHVAEHVVGVCVKDCVRDPKPDVNIAPGDGVVDFQGVFDRLRAAGFDGPCVVECLGGDSPDDVQARARRTREMLRELLGA